MMMFLSKYDGFLLDEQRGRLNNDHEGVEGPGKERSSVHVDQPQIQRHLFQDFFFPRRDLRL